MHHTQITEIKRCHQKLTARIVTYIATSSPVHGLLHNIYRVKVHGFLRNIHRINVLMKTCYWLNCLYILLVAL